MSILTKAKATLSGRVIGCLIADGTDPALIASLKAGAKANNAKVKVIAPKLEGTKGLDGKPIQADLHLDGGPSVLFDSIVVALSSEGAQKLAMQAAAVGFVSDAYAHLKVIGHTPGAAALLQRANIMPDRGIVPLQSPTSPETFLALAAKGRV